MGGVVPLSFLSAGPACLPGPPVPQVFVTLPSMGSGGDGFGGGLSSLSEGQHHASPHQLFPVTGGQLVSLAFPVSFCPPHGTYESQVGSSSACPAQRGFVSALAAATTRAIAPGGGVPLVYPGDTQCEEDARDSEWVCCQAGFRTISPSPPVGERGRTAPSLGVHSPSVSLPVPQWWEMTEMVSHALPASFLLSGCQSTSTTEWGTAVREDGDVYHSILLRAPSRVNQLSAKGLGSLRLL